MKFSIKDFFIFCAVLNLNILLAYFWRYILGGLITVRIS